MSNYARDQDPFLNQLGPLRPYLLYILQNHFRDRFASFADREDLVQEVCVKAIERISLFRGETMSQFRAWIRRMLIHSAIDLARRTQSHQPPEPLIDVLDPTVLEPIDLIQIEQENLVLLHALQQLSESDRQLVLAHYFQGKTLTELATEFQDNLKTIQKRKERALHRLQDHLNGGGRRGQRSAKGWRLIDLGDHCSVYYPTNSRK